MVRGTPRVGGTPLDPHMVARAFVDQYYRILQRSPDQVYRIYQESSIVSRPDVNGMMTSATTLQGINQKIMEMDVGKYLWEIETADAQPSYLSGVFIVVTGYLTGPDCIRRPFAQSFFLAPQENTGFFLLNDILRISVDRPAVVQAVNLVPVTANGSKHVPGNGALHLQPNDVIPMQANRAVPLQSNGNVPLLSSAVVSVLTNGTGSRETTQASLTTKPDHEHYAHSWSCPRSQPSKCSKPTNAAAITARPAIKLTAPDLPNQVNVHSWSCPRSQPSKCSKPTNAAAITARPAVKVTVPDLPNQEDMELAMAIKASIQSAIIEGVPDVFPFVTVAQSHASFGTNGLATSSSTHSTFNRWGPPSSGTDTNKASSSTALNRGVPPDTLQVQTQSALSAPPINASFYTGPIKYPPIDSSPIHISTAPGTVNTTLGAVTGSSDKINEGAGTCVICLDAPVEGACIPCGHMAGCMGCLRGVKEKRGKCPICRAKINQVLKLYAV